MRDVDTVGAVVESPLWCEEAHQWASSEALGFDLVSAALQLAHLRLALLKFCGRYLVVYLIAHCFFEELEDVWSFAQLHCEVLHSSAFGIETLVGEGRASFGEGSSVGQWDFFKWFCNWKNETGSDQRCFNLGPINKTEFSDQELRI